MPPPHPPSQPLMQPVLINTNVTTYLPNDGHYLYLASSCFHIWKRYNFFMVGGGGVISGFGFGKKTVEKQISYTDKKENKIFLIYKEIQKWSSCKVIYD